MARKSVADLKSAERLEREALEDWQAVSEVKGEIAQGIYDAQNEDTQRAIDSIVGTLRQYATGYVDVQLSPPSGAVVPVKIEQEYVDFNLLYLAIEIAKNLAIIGICLSKFEFPESLCAQCGAELGIPELRKKVKR